MEVDIKNQPRLSKQQIADLKKLAEYCHDWKKLETRKIRLADLSQCFLLTKRSVQYWLQRMISGGWINWDPAYGRGYLAQLTLLKNPTDRLFNEAQYYAQQQLWEKAFDLVPKAYRAELLNLSSKAVPNTGLDKQIIMIPFYRAIHDVNPFTCQRRTESHIISHIHARLVEHEEGKGITPSLAHHWQISSKLVKGKQRPVYRFFLRKSVYFHDGSLLVAEDVKASFDFLANAGVAHSVLTNCIMQIKAEQQVLEITLQSENTLFLNCLALDCFSVVKNPHNLMPVGCGQYEIIEKMLIVVY